MRIRIGTVVRWVTLSLIVRLTCAEPEFSMDFSDVIIIVLYHLYAPKRYCFGQELAPFQTN